MDSHELARYLLSRRANDIQIEVLIDRSGDLGTYEFENKIVELRDHPEEVNKIKSEDVVFYNSISDRVVIRAGELFLGDIQDVE